MISSLKKALEPLNLSEKQAKVLGVLLESGPMLAAGIARATNLNRTTVYDVLKELLERGLVSYTKRDGALRYQSISPELLPAYVERQRDVFEESRKQLAALVPELKLLRARGRSLPKVQFFEGVEGVKQAYEDVLENNQEKLLRGITDMTLVYKDMDNAWVEYYLKKRTRFGIRCIDLTPENEAGRRSHTDDQKYLRVTKFLPANCDLGGDVSIYDNKVGLFSYVRESPVAVIIEDENISHMFKRLFDFMEQHCSLT